MSWIFFNHIFLSLSPIWICSALLAPFEPRIRRNKTLVSAWNKGAFDPVDTHAPPRPAPPSPQHSSHLSEQTLLSSGEARGLTEESSVLARGYGGLRVGWGWAGVRVRVGRSQQQYTWITPSQTHPSEPLEGKWQDGSSALMMPKLWVWCDTMINDTILWLLKPWTTLIDTKRWISDPFQTGKKKEHNKSKS